MSQTSTSDDAPDGGVSVGTPLPPPLPPPLPLPSDASHDATPPAASPVPPSPSRPVSLLRASFGDGLTAAAMLVVANVVLALGVAVVHGVRIAAAGGTVPAEHAMIAELMPQLVVAAVFGTLLAGVLTWVFRARRLPRLAAMPAAVAYPLAIGAGMLIQGMSIGISLLSDSVGASAAPSNADLIEDLARQTPWLMWALVVLVAPVAEELLFRHVLLRRFALAGRAVLGLVVTSVLFAALHEPVPGASGMAAWLASFVLYVAMGAGFGMVYVRTGRLGAAVAAHAACNLMALSLAAFSAS